MTEKRKIGMVGLGQMGRPIALNLLRDDTSLYVGARHSDSLVPLKDKAALATTRLADLQECDIVFLCLPDALASRDVLLGRNGIQPRKGTLVVDLSTGDYSQVMALASDLNAGDIRYLDAPISGMEARAIDATLTVMCGGARKDFELAAPYFDRIGTTILHVGTTGSGQLIKVINQLLYNINIAGLAEILPMAQHLGLDPEQVTRVVNSGTGRSHASEYFLPKILAGHFANSYPLDKAYKDMVTGAELATRNCIPTPVLAAATATYQMTMRNGLGGDNDKSSMIQLFENMLGLSFRSTDD